MSASFDFTFGAKTAGHNKAVKGMGTVVSDVSNKMVTAFKSVGTAFVAAFSIGKIQGAISDMSNLYHEVEKLGVEAEELQLFRYIFESIGSSSSNAGTALQRFSRRLGEAALGQGVLAKELDRYKISLTDVNGNQRSTVEILRDYADATASAKTSNEQLRMTVAAFDSEGAAFKEVLKGGSEAIDQLIKDFESAGGAIDKFALEDMAKLDQEFYDLKHMLEQDFRRAIIGVVHAFKGEWGTLNDVVSKWGIFFTQVMAGSVDRSLTLFNRLALGIGYALEDGAKLGGAAIDQLVSHGILKIKQLVKAIADAPWYVAGPLKLLAKQWDGVDGSIQKTKDHIQESKDYVKALGGEAKAQLGYILSAESKISVTAEAVKDFYDLQNDELEDQKKNVKNVEKGVNSWKEATEKNKKSVIELGDKVVDLDEKTKKTGKSFIEVDGKIVQVGASIDTDTEKAHTLKSTVDTVTTAANGTKTAVDSIGTAFEGVGKKGKALAAQLNAAKAALDSYKAKETASLQKLLNDRNELTFAQQQQKNKENYENQNSSTPVDSTGAKVFTIDALGTGSDDSIDTTDSTDTSDSSSGGSGGFWVDSIIPNNLSGLSVNQIFGYVSKIQEAYDRFSTSQSKFSHVVDSFGMASGYAKSFTSRRQSEIDALYEELSIRSQLSGGSKMYDAATPKLSSRMIDDMMNSYQQATDSISNSTTSQNETNELLRQLITLQQRKS